jgi:hypothetical protein
MGALRAGRELRLEQSGYKKRVAVKFHCPGFAMFSARHYLQPSGGQLRLIFRIDFVIAEKLLHHFVASVNALQQRTGFQTNTWNGTAELGIGRAALRNGADNWRNNDVLGLRIVFRAVGIGELQNVSGTL